ncbi:hypothetical protein PCANC_14996 [Puccinia coronata f. sp. avenae]|uniref:Uncharacterized protein n=1 Tax=Puccinia coronata f. sp. avenae TaxID=200324 RepID=A0A2N5SRD5_9BASI|nr:hypothetical protein PCANC_14996 [Puccinia coronata f. sp. avenae]
MRPKSASQRIALQADTFSIDVFVRSYLPRHGFRKRSQVAFFLGPFATTKHSSTP